MGRRKPESKGKRGEEVLQIAKVRANKAESYGNLKKLSH